MKFANVNLDPDNSNIHRLVSEAKNILGSEADLNDEKEKLNQIFNRVDFLLKKYDTIYDKFTDTFTSMSQLNFNNRIPFYEDGDHFINFIISGINITNEELKANAIGKDMFQSLLNKYCPNNTLIAITDCSGEINTFFCKSDFVRIDADFVNGQNIQVLFSDFEILEKAIKEKGTIRDLRVDISYKGIIFPAIVDIAISGSRGQINSIIYMAKLY